MGGRIVADVAACKSCKVGSCCYEGVELSSQEVRRIVQSKPPVPKPWFRLVEQREGIDVRKPFSTVLRNGSCVFHDKDNRCMIYKVRPEHCREFPLENNKTASFYRRLCVLFHSEWSPNSSMRRAYNQREQTDPLSLRSSG